MHTAKELTTWTAWLLGVAVVTILTIELNLPQFLTGGF